MSEIISTSFKKLDIHDPFFDSLKSMYRGFDDWFSKKAEYEEPCDVVFGEDGTITFVKKDEKKENANKQEAFATTENADNAA